MIPWTHPSPQLKRHLDCFSRLCAGHRRMSLYFTTGRLSFPLKIARYSWGTGPHLIHGSLDPP